MIEYVSDALLAALFPLDAGDPEILRVTGPVAVDEAVEASAIEYAGTRHLVFFADVMAYAAQDEEFVRQTAEAWNGGFQPAAHSRLVKFFRAEADQQTMFSPGDWPLPDPAMTGSLARHWLVFDRGTRRARGT